MLIRRLAKNQQKWKEVIKLMGSMGISIRFVADDGTSGTETFLFPDTTTLAQVEGWLDGGGLAAIDGVTGCQITEVVIHLEYDSTGLTPALAGSPVTGSSYVPGALFGFRAADEATQSYFIPGVIPALRSGADVLQTGAVQDFIDAAISPGIDVAAVDITLSNRGGSPLTLFRYVDLKSRKL